MDPGLDEYKSGPEIVALDISNTYQVLTIASETAQGATKNRSILEVLLRRK